jgi:hypothetical protein
MSRRSSGIAGPKIAQTDAAASLGSWLRQWAAGWDRFWFTPRLPHTLAVIRIATGAMLFYTHLVLAFDLLSFLGPHAWVEPELARNLHNGTFGPADAGWSYLWWIESPRLLWAHHGVTMLLAAAMMLGVATRVTVPLSWLLQLMYMHRLTGALFGLDQITTMLAMYLMLAPCGAVFSIDAWWRRRRLAGGADLSTRRARFWLPAPEPSVAANVATRLMQLHVCVIYLFGGLWKARGEMWWDGTAMWFAAANFEYQSNDLTWLSQFPLLFAALTHVTIFWETFYCALVWPRLTRPLVLLTAVLVHGGIALFLGMITFGLMMIVANGAFLEPQIWLRRKGADAKPSVAAG